MKTVPVLLLFCSAFGRILNEQLLEIVEAFAEPRISMKMAAIDKQWRNVKITGKLDVFPNESPTKMFYDMETLEISWTDPDNIVLKRPSLMQTIENAVQMQPRPMCNTLFDAIDNWRACEWDRKPFFNAVMLAMSFHVDVDRVGKFKHEPLKCAAQNGFTKAVENLIKRDAKTEADADGTTALWWAAFFGNTNVCEMLLENQANPNRGDNYGDTPLMEAARQGYVGTVYVLLRFKADVNLQGKAGKTALMLAVNPMQAYSTNNIGCAFNCRTTAVVDLLLKFGADPTITDKSGRTALQQTSCKCSLAILSSAKKTARQKKLKKTILFGIILSALFYFTQIIFLPNRS